MLPFALGWCRDAAACRSACSLTHRKDQLDTPHGEMWRPGRSTAFATAVTEAVTPGHKRKNPPDCSKRVF